MYYVSGKITECLQIFFYSRRSQRTYFMPSFCSLAVQDFKYKKLGKEIIYLIYLIFRKTKRQLAKLKILLVRLTCSIFFKDLMKASGNKIINYLTTF